MNVLLDNLAVLNLSESDQVKQQRDEQHVEADHEDCSHKHLVYIAHPPESGIQISIDNSRSHCHHHPYGHQYRYAYLGSWFLQLSRAIMSM